MATSLVTMGSASAASASVPENPAPSCVTSDIWLNQLDCTVTYTSTGGEQVFTPPAGVTSVDIELIGGRGASLPFKAGGRGDRLSGSYAVSSSTPLYVYVGGAGSAGSGGYNGGGAPGDDHGMGRKAGGGGATDIRTLPESDDGSLASRIAVAGGGGGAAALAAGGDAGQPGEPTALSPTSSGEAGTQSAGGAGGSASLFNAGAPGTLGAGGAGGDFVAPGAEAGGGGGGGGLYGGGGGMSNGFGAGGGGSSLVPSGWQQELSGASAVARFSYRVPIQAVAISAPVVPALQAAAVTVTASTALPGHSASFAHRVTSMEVMSAIGPGTQPSDVTCTTSSCTSSRAGTYLMQAVFGAWPGPASFSLNFLPLIQSIDFAGDTIGVQQPKQLVATASSGLPVTLTLDSGPCALVGNTLTANDLGTCNVTAKQAGANPYLPASSVTRAFTTEPVSLVASSDPQALTATAGVAYSFPVELQNAQGAPVDPQPVIDYSFDPECDFGADNVATRAGSCEVTATVRGSTSLTTTFTVEVVAAEVAALAITPSATSVRQGGSLTFAITGEDAYGNPVDTSAATLTSSVASDQISGWTVSFPHASPHVITARLGSVTASVSIEVIAATQPAVPPADKPTGLSNTGQTEGVGTMTVAAALALLVLGATLILVRRKTGNTGC